MKLLKASLQLIIGVIFGLLLFEGILHANPRLLLRGMALPAPVDSPLQEQIYDVKSSDADLFYWYPELIRPVLSEDNKIEARVNYFTDELGFPNQAPMSPTVDVIVLGRSYSMGAQATNPWPRMLADKYDLSVFNLSQTGSGIDTKYEYFSKFGLRRHPKWVIIEILPSMDIIGYVASQKTLVQSLPVPVIQQLIKRIRNTPAQAKNVEPIYPLRIHIPNRSIGLSFFSYYLAALTVDNISLMESNQWRDYKRAITSLIDLAQMNDICVALLYVPTKENIYFHLSENPYELNPVLTGWLAWKLNDLHQLERDDKMLPDIDLMRKNVFAARDLVADFAKQRSIPLIDPTQVMLEAQNKGDEPFMVYDTHWSSVGHGLVADLVAQTLKNTDCR